MILVVGFLLVGAFSAFTDGVQRSHLSRLVEDRYKGTAYGYLNAAVGFGALVAGIAGGYVWQQFGDTTDCRRVRHSCWTCCFSVRQYPVMKIKIKSCRTDENAALIERV